MAAYYTGYPGWGEGWLMVREGNLISEGGTKCLLVMKVAMLEDPGFWEAQSVFAIVFVRF